ncbi:DinB family protein [Bacillus salitolerans]|uniref:DinB family protein n=1 Tax=Bacillus salitolerans TaxID=1437434 RepID=A0ABW4LRF9_9BACI
MKEESIFKQFVFVRKRTLAMLDTLSVNQIDKIPTGFNNNILWNIGHIFVSTESLLYGFVREQSPIEDRYVKLFTMNTSPKNWSGDIPSFHELKDNLTLQLERVQKEFTGRLHEEGAKPFDLGTVQFTTVAEVFNFAIWHEGLHQGTITCLNKVLNT